MTDNMPVYDLAAVRELLLAAFGAEDLRRLFLYTADPELRPLVDEFGSSDGLTAMIDKTIPYCQKRTLLPNLLAEVRRANPRQYERFAPRLVATPPTREAPSILEPGALTTLTKAARGGRLLILWGLLPFPLADRPPSNRALALASLPASPELPERWAGWLPGLPPLPILSLDASDRLERAFDAAGVRLRQVLTIRDVLGQHEHCLLKLAGDRASRTGLILSRAEVRNLHEDPDKRYLLDEARRVAVGGAVLLLGCDPVDADFRAWWVVLAPQFQGTAFLAVGEPSAPWPQGITCLGPDLHAIRGALEVAPTMPGPVPAGSGRETAYFGQTEIFKIRDVLISAGFGSLDKLAGLFGGMNRTYAANLPTEGAPAVRLLAVLNALNGTGRLVGGELPFETFLYNAVQISYPLPQSTELQCYLDTLRERAF